MSRLWPHGHDNTVNTLPIISHNMHCFNQLCEFLNDLCTLQKHDISFLQEHWLSPDAMCKLKTMNEIYLCYGVSAIEEAVSSGYLSGRPFWWNLYLR